MCALEKYNCHICPAGEMRDLLIAHQGVYKKAWLAALKNFTKQYDVESLSSAAFFKAYEKSCVAEPFCSFSTQEVLRKMSGSLLWSLQKGRMLSIERFLSELQ